MEGRIARAEDYKWQKTITYSNVSSMSECLSKCCADDPNCDQIQQARYGDSIEDCYSDLIVYKPLYHCMVDLTNIERRHSL